MNCKLCDKTNSANIDLAIESGWIPNFWCNDQEYGPVCPHCTGKYLEEDGEAGWQIKDVFRQTFLDSSSSTRFNMALADCPAAFSLYPDLELISRLREKFLTETIDAFTRDEIVDLINHQHQRILDLEQTERELDKEIQTIQDEYFKA